MKMMEAIKMLSEKYGFEYSEAMSYVKGGEKPSVLLPWCGSFVDTWCHGIRTNHGLYSQCTQSRQKGGKLCKTCQKHADSSSLSTVSERLETGIMDYKDPKTGKNPVPYANVMAKLNIDRETAVAEAAKFGLTIPDIQFELKKPARGRPKKASTTVTDSDDESINLPKRGRGRPRKEKPVVESNPADDLIAGLIKEANNAKTTDTESTDADDTNGAPKPAKKSTGKPKLTEEEKAAKAAEKLAKQQEKEAKAAEKLAKQQEREAAKAAKEAEKLKKQQEREAKAAEKLAKQQEKEAKAAEKPASPELTADVAEEPAAPVAEEPAAPVSEEPAAPVAEEPAPGVEQPPDSGFCEAEIEDEEHEEEEENEGAKPASPELTADVAEEPANTEVFDAETEDEDDEEEEEEEDDEEEEEEIKVSRFSHNGLTYLRDQNGVVYDEKEHTAMGIWNEETKMIESFDNHETEEEEEEDGM